MKFDQCLFGYDDGHKLLASSLSLGTETSYLTELSDLAPGTIFGSSEGYWTGVPAPAIGRYVLMRTWPAPEMPRPGCVWTHALLIEPSLLETLADLSVLKTFAVRPTGVFDVVNYRFPLEMNFPDSEKFKVSLDEDIVQRLIATLYGKGSPSVVVSSPGEIDDPLFAVWSQQWPRLRRNLRFQSSASRLNHSSSSISSSARFDVMTLIGGHREFTREALGSANIEWIDAAIRDVQMHGEDELRRFLWIYGADVKRQRNSFRPLVELCLINSKPEMYDKSQAVSLVLSAFPTFKDAAKLKQDLVDGFLIAPSQVEVLKYFLSSNDEAVFPPPTKSGIERLVCNWGGNPESLLSLAELAAKKTDDVSVALFSAITSKIQTPNFWGDTVSFPLLRNHMLQANPQLLLEAGALDLDDEALFEKIHLISGSLPGVDGFVFRTLSRNSKKLVEKIFETFPKVLAAQIILAENEGGKNLDGVWRAALVQRPRLLLTNNVLGKVSRTSVLYDYANSLGWIVPEVFAAGAGPWVAALQTATNDLWGEKEDALYTFVLILSLIAANKDSVKGVELLFDTVHTSILNNRLFGRAREITSFWLPELGWFTNWDLGLRLRIMVTTAYVSQGWSMKSFASLSKDPKTLSLLADAASDTPGGKPFAKAIRR